MATLATRATTDIRQLPRMALLYVIEYLQPNDALVAGCCCKTLQENSSYDWLWKQYYNRRWLFRGRNAVNKEAYIRRHLTDKGMEEGKASQYSVTTMRAGAIVNAVRVRNQDVFVGYDDGRVLVWDASIGGRTPKYTLTTLPEAVQSLWLHRQSYLIAVSTSTVMAWKVTDEGYQSVWEQRFDGLITSAHLTDNVEHMIIGFDSTVARLVHISSGACVEITNPRAARATSVFIEAEASESDDMGLTSQQGTASGRSLWSSPITAFVCATLTDVSVFISRGEGDFALLPNPPVRQNTVGSRYELMVTHSKVTLLSITLDGGWHTATLSVAGARAAWRAEHSCLGQDHHRVVCVKRQGLVLAMGMTQGETRVYSLTTGTLLHSLAGHSGVVTAICLDQNKCLTGGSDKCMKVWKLEGARPQALYVLLGGSRTTGGRDHPQRPGCSEIVLDDDRVVAAFGEVLRVYSFAV